MTTARARILWEIVEEHLDEAAFLSSQLDRALASPRYTVEEAAGGPERRLLLHLEGIHLGGERARDDLLAPALAGDDPERALAAALALLGGPWDDGPARVAGRLSGDPARDAPLVRALQLAHAPGVEGPLLDLAHGDDPPRAAAAIDVLAFRGVPVEADLLRPLARRDDPALSPPALRAARLCGKQLAAELADALASSHGAVRDAAIETALVAGVPGAWRACRTAVQAERADAAFPLLALSASDSPAANELIVGALRADALRRSALFALGFAGRAGGAVACLAELRGPHARVAAEAFSAITGLAIEGAFAIPEEAAAGASGLDEEDLDADLATAEGDLPLPDPGAVAAWWGQNAGRFEPGKRYAGGELVAEGATPGPMPATPCRRRRALALQLAIRTKGERWIETRALPSDQLGAERSGRTAFGGDPTAPFRHRPRR